MCFSHFNLCHKQTGEETGALRQKFGLLKASLLSTKDLLGCNSEHRLPGKSCSLRFFVRFDLLHHPACIHSSVTVNDNPDSSSQFGFLVTHFEICVVVSIDMTVLSLS